MRYLFENFLEDQSVYLNNEIYYKNLFTQVIGEPPVQFYNTTFRNGEPFFNGNPIFNAKRKNRLIRIIQEEPEFGEPYFKARIEIKDNKTEELIIYLELTEEVKPTLEIYLKKWFRDRVSISEMKKLFKKYSITKEDTPQNVVSEPEIDYHKKDDLTVIDGIGPKIASLLNDKGIFSFDQLSNTSIKQLNRIIRNGGKRFNFHIPVTWPKQAKGRTQKEENKGRIQKE